MADYVVVGAGSSGCVLAARLSEDPDVSVTLVEAGGSDRHPNVRIPAAFSKLFKTDRDWNYSTTGQATLGDRELFWPRGKMLGGSSSMNAQMWIRGHRADYDGWADGGCAGWGYDDVLPYFQRAESYGTVANDPDHDHGRGGPQHLSDLRDPNPLTRAFIEACVNDGMHRLRHHNQGDNEGVAQTIVTQRRGLRWSTNDAYLRPARRRPNLEILTGALARRVEFDGRRAVGVQYSRKDGSIASVTASREVILCGGSVNSPQLLMLSGIGDPDHLSDLGIEATVASPRVGANLQDHVMVALVMASRDPVTLVDAEKPGELLNYLARRRGMLTSNVGEAAAFFRTDGDLPAPDIELIFGPVPYIDHGQIEEDPGHGFALGPILLQPQSRGSVTLASADPTVSPLIDPGYFTAAGDRATMRTGLRRALALLEVAPLASMVGEPIEAPAGDDDASIDEFLDEQCETLYHPVGTCAMGTDEDAVVDPELRVRGVEGLRVADASVMPSLNRGHTHAPAVMIGERAAVLVREVRTAPTVGR